MRSWSYGLTPWNHPDVTPLVDEAQGYVARFGIGISVHAAAKRGMLTVGSGNFPST